uniref:Uncharacterized protein n=1 Tax=Anguilla anguilla TaxID=7936 RepID=A0A0E9VRL5_ANGAN
MLGDKSSQQSFKDCLNIKPWQRVWSDTPGAY